MDVAPDQFTALYAVITVAFVMLYVSVRKGTIDVRDGESRCPSCGKLHRRSRPCRCSETS
jgi:hypothetical protein